MQVKLGHCIASELLKVDVPLLGLYAQALTKSRKLASKADKATEWGKACRVAAMLARSLRLTPQSRLDKVVAGRMARDADERAALQELLGTNDDGEKPWQTPGEALRNFRAGENGSDDDADAG